MARARDQNGENGADAGEDEEERDVRRATHLDIP
jgi:hypothetical protein